MSTIQVTNINDLSDNAALVTDNGGIKTDKLTGITGAGTIAVVAEGDSTTTDLQQGLEKAWCSLDDAATVVFYDPTPRAVKYFEVVCENFGNESTIDYVSGGDQPVETYDLSKLTSDNFVYKQYALWNENGKVKFFRPSNENYVSHSINNIQRNYNEKDSNFIEVDAIKLSDDIKNMDKFPSILKLDIEGAALEVLEDLFENEIFIDQICIEFDEQNVPGKISNNRIDAMNKLFESNNYKCVHNNMSDYLFVSKKFLEGL